MRLTSEISLSTFQGMTLDQLRAAYREIRAAVLATEYGKAFADTAAFDAFMKPRAPVERYPVRTARNFLLAACGQLLRALAVKHVIPPSEETLAWGGFLGGEIHWDHEHADAVILKILRG